MLAKDLTKKSTLGSARVGIVEGSNFLSLVAMSEWLLRKQ